MDTGADSSRYVELALLVVFTLASFSLLVFSVARIVGNSRRAMRKLAESLGVPLQGGERLFPRVHGFGWIRKSFFILDVWRGRELHIYFTSKGQGRHKQVWTSVDVPLIGDAVGARLVLTRIGWMSAAGLGLGGRLAATGDEVFDKLFAIKCADEGLVRRAFTPELRALISSVWDEKDVSGVVHVCDGRVHYEEPGAVATASSRRRIEAVAGVCNALAVAVEAASAAC